MSERPKIGWRTQADMIREFRQGGIADRWSERRLLILLAEYRLFIRHQHELELRMQGRWSESPEK